MAENKWGRKSTQRSAKSTPATKKKTTGFSAEERAAMKERAAELRAEGVDTRCYFDPPVHLQQSHRADPPVSLPVTEDAALRWRFR